MNRFEMAVRTARGGALGAIDLSMFTAQDIANVAVQRSEVLLDVPGNAPALRAWAEGDDGPILDIAGTWGTELVRRALAFVFMEYRELRPLLRKLSPSRIADIGCGAGFFALFAHAEFGAEMVLIDTESSDDRVLRYSPRGAGCTDLVTTRRFLRANGCDARKMYIVNPDHDDLAPYRDVDLAVSFLTCGFLFPVANYRHFLEHNLRPGGSAILDIRSRRATENTPLLDEMGQVDRLGAAGGGKAIRMHLARDGAAERRAA